jgi:hypothetical protein
VRYWAGASRLCGKRKSKTGRNTDFNLEIKNPTNHTNTVLK